MTLPILELRHLHIFPAAADQGSFREAAQLHTLRFSASRRIRDLERLLGSTLFIRRPDGAQMTEVGKRSS